MDPSSLSSLGPEMWPFPAVGAPPPYVRSVIARPGRVAPAEESVVTGPSRESGKGRRKRKDSGAPEDDFSKPVSTSSGHDLSNVKAKHMKTINPNDNNNVKTEVEASSGACNKTNDEKPQQEPAKQDYIHVRARRGQATDSHSLAERARREKISERMKTLQDLVPGCNRVIGKASVLDEIINYIQALQHQIEFLSMKLEAVTPRSHPGFEVFPHKDFTLQADDSASSLPSSSLATREYEQGSAAGWLHMQLGGAFERVT